MEGNDMPRAINYPVGDPFIVLYPDQTIAKAVVGEGTLKVGTRSSFDIFNKVTIAKPSASRPLVRPKPQCERAEHWVIAPVSR